MKRIAGINKKWKLIAVLVPVLLLIFLPVYAYVAKDKSHAAATYYVSSGDGTVVKDGYVMRRKSDTFSILPADVSNVEWTLSRTGILNLSSSSGRAINVVAENMGDVMLTVKAKNASGDEVLNESYKITVAFAINEYIGDVPTGATTGPAIKEGVSIKRIFDTDDKYSIVMEPDGKVAFGESAEDEPYHLNLNFGSAKSNTVDWTSGNDDVVAIDEDLNGDGSGIKGIRAVGAGTTSLSVTWRDATQTHEASIQVYVRPRITLEDKDIGTNASGGSDDVIEISNGDKIGVSVKFQANQLVSISDKLVWVISKTVDTRTILVRDSLGNTTKDYEEEASLEWIPSENCYRVNAKAGKYSVAFYVKGTYKDFEEQRNIPPGCEPVFAGNGIYVFSEYKDLHISLNVGGTLNLPDAFNITNATFAEHFTRVIDPGSAATATPDVEEDDSTDTTTGPSITEEPAQAEDSNNIVDFTSDSNRTVLRANSIGQAIVRVTAQDSIESTLLNGEIKSGKRVTIVITVTDTFSLNISKTNMSIGQELQLYGVLASGKEEDGVTYEWVSEDDPKGSYVKITPSERYATIKAVKSTAVGSPVHVTLKRTDRNGKTLTATCEIIVDSSTSSFHIVPSTLTMEAGVTQTVTTDLKGSYSLAWISSDTNVVTVVDSSTAIPSAQVTAKKPGTAVITAVNAANNVYATCIVTVQQPITSLDIGVANKVYTTYDTTLPQGFIFMQAIYKPNNATEKDFKWDSSDKTVATVDNTGKVTLLKEGSTYISCASAKFTAFCILNIVSKPLSSIKTDVTELNMVKGDTYTVKATFAPVDATDSNLIWTSLDDKVAKVDNTGKITATGVGTTYINVEAALADSSGNKAKALVKVNVRDKLASIAFDSNTTYINVGGTKQIDVIYKPSTDVNKNVTFRSSDTSIFTVDKSGIIKGIAVGQAILTCESEELGMAGVISCIVHVTASTVDAKDFVITPAAETIYIGATLQLVKTFTPNNATNQNVTWSSSDPGIVSVTATGTVKGVKEGRATVSAVYTDTKDKIPLIRTSTITVTAAPIRVTDFDVNPASSNIKVGEKFTLAPVFKPNNASNKNVEYQSLDTGIVTVDEKGEVTGIGAGDALIQCQAEDGGYIATCAVHVDSAIEFSLSPSSKEIAVGKSFKIKKVTNPENAKKAAEWSTSNAAIATVDSNGNVTTKRIGTCTITCKLTKYNQSAKCKVKVQKLKTSIDIDKKNIRLGVGQTYRLKKTIKTNNTSTPGVKWKSSSKRVATVSSGGKITGRHVGNAKITVTTNDNIHARATCRVRVIQRVSGIKLSSDYIVCYVGRSKKIKAKCVPSNSTIKKLKWTSGDNSIARVTASGKVRGIAEGNTYITAAATDGSNKKARCYIKVLDSLPATSIVVAQPALTLKRGDSAKLTYKVLPDGSTDKLKFASNNNRVARVSSKGKVTAVGTGDAVITILASSGITSEVDVNVVALNKNSVTMRQYDTETLNVFGTAGKTVTWYTSNAAVATVDNNGMITGKSEGSAYIYAYVDGCKLACLVTITSVNG